MVFLMTSMLLQLLTQHVDQRMLAVVQDNMEDNYTQETD